jgi:hypothetical protein
MISPLFGKQEVGIWRVKKHFPRYGVPIWSFWPNIRFLPSIVAEKNAMKNEHICSMCIKINSRQTGSRNLMGQKMLPTIWGTHMKLVTKFQISAINSCWEKCDEKCAYMFNVYINQLSWQTGSRNLMGPKTLPQYGIPIWRLWPNIRFLPSTVTEKNVTKNILDGRKDRGKTVYPLPLWGAGGINTPSISYTNFISEIQYT